FISLQEIYPSFLSKNKAQPFETIGNIEGEFNIGLGAADQDIHLALFLQDGDDIARPAEMPVSGCLDRVSYFHCFMSLNSFTGLLKSSALLISFSSSSLLRIMSSNPSGAKR